MIKKPVMYQKMYFGFPVILISYYDTNKEANVTTLSSSFSLGEMIVLGFGKNSYAAKQIKGGADFVVNIPDQTLMREVDICGAHSGHRDNKFELSKLKYEQSQFVNAPSVLECPISIACTPLDVIVKEEFPSYLTVFAKVKGRMVREDLLDNDGHLIYGKLDVVEYLGDDHRRAYRYLEGNRYHPSRSFLDN